MSERRRRPELVLGVAVITALGVLATRLNERGTDVPVVSFTAGVENPDGDIERGILHARAVTACSSLTPEREDEVIERATGFPGKDAYREFQITSSENATPFLIGKINAANLDILVGCLRERNERGDREAARRLEMVGFW